MENDPKEQMEKALNSLKNKENKIYFLVQDTKGSQRAAVATAYEFAKILNEDGYNTYILHEKNDYHGVGEWLGEEYSSLPHASIESKELSVGPADYLVIPELYGHVMDQTKEMPCTRIVLAQAYDYIFEMLSPGHTWGMLGINKVITTSEGAKNYIDGLFPGMDTSVIKLGMPEYFKVSDKPKKPIVTIHTRDPRETMKIVKSFYVKYPQFKWITFKDMRGMSRQEFATALGEACVSVWVDDISGFGTFPIESMLSNTPIIGKVPNLKPDWLEEKNGFWTFDPNQIINILSAYLKNWLEDSVPTELYDAMAKSVEPYTLEGQKEQVLSTFKRYIDERILDMEDGLNKLQPVETEKINN